MDVTVIVGTFGDEKWSDLAHERAIPSVPESIPVIHAHADTLQEARNIGLYQASTEWVCHLDADDELTPDYFDRMAEGSADVRAPSVRYIRGGIPYPPGMPQVWAHHHECHADCLPDGNWIVVGAVARTSLLRDIGGWRDFDWSEDWDVWLRCHLAGASIEAVPQAVYVAHVRPDSRNRAPAKAAKLAAHQAIYNANFPEGRAA
jgi:glycosyltransferase involved in cell wall biosynthesis